MSLEKSLTNETERLPIIELREERAKRLEEENKRMDAPLRVRKGPNPGHGADQRHL